MTLVNVDFCTSSWARGSEAIANVCGCNFKP